MTDTLDIRDLIKEYEELETELTNHFNNDIPLYGMIAKTAQKIIEDNDLMDDLTHYHRLEELLSALKDGGGDEQWKGDWYPVTLINETYFEESMDDLVKDCYEIDTLNLPAFITTTIDYDMLKLDYSEVTYDGDTYYYR